MKNFFFFCHLTQIFLYRDNMDINKGSCKSKKMITHGLWPTLRSNQPYEGYVQTLFFSRGISEHGAAEHQFKDLSQLQTSLLSHEILEVSQKLKKRLVEKWFEIFYRIHSGCPRLLSRNCHIWSRMEICGYPFMATWLLRLWFFSPLA